MPLKAYGVLITRAVDTRREGAAGTPHYQIHLTDDSGTHFRAAVNVLSAEQPSELLYLVSEDFQHPVTARLEGLPSGWNTLLPGPGGPNLDFVRGNLFDPAQLRTLPPDASGPDNDLADLLDHYVRRAVDDPDARLYVFGERFGPEPTVKDKVFGFLPGNGVHDIHMNQGNSRRFSGDDGVWQDGGLLIHFPAQSRWVGIFLAFQSQSWHTDDTTGHTLEGTDGSRPDPGSQPVRVVAALVNPVARRPSRRASPCSTPHPTRSTRPAGASGTASATPARYRPAPSPRVPRSSSRSPTASNWATRAARSPSSTPTA